MTCLIHCDLDQTYLMSSFESLSGLIKTVRESADDKKAFPLAPEVMSLVSFKPLNRLFFLSASPKQLAPVLNKKLRSDDISYQKLILKDGYQRVKQGGFREIFNQIAYKLSHLFSSRLKEELITSEVLIGDDTEADPIIYLIYWGVVTGRIDMTRLEQILKICGLKLRSYQEVLVCAERIQIQDRDFPIHIFIHLTRKGPQSPFLLFPSLLKVTSGWDQMAILFTELELLTLEELEQILDGYTDFQKSALIESLHQFSPLKQSFVTDLTKRWGLSLRLKAYHRDEARSFEQLILAWRDQ